MIYKDCIIHLVCANVENGVYGDVYISFNDLKEEHPNKSYMFGYYVESTDDYEDTPDWFDTVEEAIHWIETRLK